MSPRFLGNSPDKSQAILFWRHIVLGVVTSFKGNYKGQTKWDKRSRIRSFSQIFADFCRFSLFPEGPNLEKFQDRPPGLKFSSKIETNDIFKRN